MYRTITVAIVHSIYSQSVREPACGAGLCMDNEAGWYCIAFLEDYDFRMGKVVALISLLKHFQG